MTERIVLTADNTPALERVLQQIVDKKEAEPFREPVDFDALGLTDYPLIIKKPMDLGTVQAGLRDGRFATIEACLDDVQLVWDNCKLYNMEESKIHKLARRLEDYTRKLATEAFGSGIAFGKNNPAYQALQEQITEVEAFDE